MTILAGKCPTGQGPIIATKAVGRRDEALRQQRTSFTGAPSCHAHRPMVRLRMQPMANPTQCRLFIRSRLDRAIQQCGKCIPRPTINSNVAVTHWGADDPRSPTSAPCNCAIHYRGTDRGLKSACHFFRGCLQCLARPCWKMRQSAAVRPSRSASACMPVMT